MPLGGIRVKVSSMKPSGTEFTILVKELRGKNCSQNCFVKGLEVKVISSMEQNGINLFQSVVL